MSLLHQARLFARRFGVDIVRFNALHSHDARMQAKLAAHGIDLIIDVGANDGGYACGVLDAGFTGRVLSFEPLEDAHSRLSKRAAKYRAWSVAPMMALGESNGEIQIHVAGNSTSSSVLPMLAAHSEAAPQSQYIGRQTCPLRRLDEVEHPDLSRASAIHLKVDTQGFEMPVLRGASGILPRVRGLQLEMSLVPLYDGQVLYRELIDWVLDSGFELHGVIPGFSDPRTGRMLQMDGIFFRP